MQTRQRMLSVALSAAVLASVSLNGCATHTQTGAVVGAAGGAVVGGAIGKATGSTARGAIIGAAVGGTAGAIIGSRMDRQAKELAQNIPGAKVERVGEGIQVTFESGLLYDFDSDVVRAEARKNLRTLAQSLDKYPGSDILVVEHTSQGGPASYNQRLFVLRAAASSYYLVLLVVDRDLVSTRWNCVTELLA